MRAATDYLLYIAATYSHRTPVRAFLVFVALTGAAVGSARAQQQEQKLLDRLLKPDMALQNRSYDQKFVPPDATVDRKARTKTFYVADRRAEKQFVTGSFATDGFTTATSRYQHTEAGTPTRNSIADLNAPYSTASYRGVRAAHESDKAIETSEFAGATRPFLGRGKSQKSLSAQDTPLTIDQVRELLNKNK